MVLKLKVAGLQARGDGSEERGHSDLPSQTSKTTDEVSKAKGSPKWCLFVQVQNQVGLEWNGAQALPSSMTLHTSLNLSEAQCALLKSGGNNIYLPSCRKD